MKWTDVKKDIISISQEYKNLIELTALLASLRREKNITQKELSNLTGIPQPNIARFEKNAHSASLSTVIKILNSLGYELKIEQKKS